VRLANVSIRPQPFASHHLPFTIYQEDKAATAEQNRTAHTVRMCNVLCYMCFIICASAMCQPQWPDPNSTRLRFKYQLNRTIWPTQKKCAQIERLPNTLDFFSPVTKPLFLATVYNDTAHLMGSL